MTTNKDIVKMIKDDDIDYVDIRFTDPRGKLQHVTLMSDQVDEDFLEEGFMFDGSSIAGWKSIDESDMKLMPDASSVYADPFYAEKTICLHCSSKAATSPSTPLTTHRTSVLKCCPR